MAEIKDAVPRPQPDEMSRESQDSAMFRQEKIEAIYALESPVRCPKCGESISSLKAVRLLRNQVNFTSTLPRRGRVVICPACDSIVPAELTNF